MQKPQNNRCGPAKVGASSARFVLLGLTGFLLGGIPSVMADSLAQSTATGPAMTVPEIRDCLCMEQQMTTDRDDLDLRQDLLNERQQELANIDHQVQEQRASLSPEDTVGQQVLKDLMAQQQTLRTAVQNDLRPAYNTKVHELNAIVGKYNAQCVNRQRYAGDMQTAQQNLQCPKP
jgi:hypothetical protein